MSSEKMSFYILQYQINGTPYLRKLSIQAKPGFYQKFLSFIMWLQKYMRFAQAFVNCMTNVECQNVNFDISNTGSVFHSTQKMF